MSFQTDKVYSRSYRGRVKGLVLDWSGTTADAHVIDSLAEIERVIADINARLVGGEKP